MNKGENKKLIPFLKNYGSNIEYNPKFLGKIKKGTGISVPYSTTVLRHCLFII